MFRIYYISSDQYSYLQGTGVFLNAFAINHDPQVWDHPYEFDPTRFLSPDGKKLIKNDSLMTFGTGEFVNTRLC